MIRYLNMTEKIKEKIVIRQTTQGYCASVLIAITYLRDIFISPKYQEVGLIMISLLDNLDILFLTCNLDNLSFYHQC